MSSSVQSVSPRELRIAEMLGHCTPEVFADMEVRATLIGNIVLEGCRDEHRAQLHADARSETACDWRTETAPPLVQLVIETLYQCPDTPVSEATRIILKSWDDWTSTDLKSSGQVESLVDVTYTLGKAVRNELPGIAELWMRDAALAAGEGFLDAEEFIKPTPSETEIDLFKLIVAYGQIDDEDLVPSLQQQYVQLLGVLPSAARMRILLEVIHLAEKPVVSINAFNPFLYCDPAHEIVSSASLHVAGVWPAIEGDPLAGVKQMLASAKDLILRRRKENTAVSILSGLLMMGDRRVIEVLRDCWRDLSPEGRVSLTHARSYWVHAPVIDWLIDWLEDSEGGEFGAVAAAVSRWGEQAKEDRVYEVHRAIPIWEGASDEVITEISRWSFADFAKRIRPRLLQIAADEQAPRVMHQVLDAWGIDHTRRLCPSVELRIPDREQKLRDLLPLLPPEAGIRNEVFGYVPLADDDFMATTGTLLLSWSIFNPYGPTWSCIGLLPTEDPGTCLVFHRMMNPFGVSGGVLATVDADWDNHIAGIIANMFATNEFATPDGDSIVMIGGAAPSCIVCHLAQSDLESNLSDIIAQSPRMAELDIHQEIAMLKEFPCQPWDRASAEIRDALSHRRGDGLITVPKPEFVTREAIAEWFDLTMNEDHTVSELVNFPGAWHGAIDNRGSAGETAFTFWQIDDFLRRFGYTWFKIFAGVTEEREH
jgi:hypothetical protein